MKSRIIALDTHYGKRNPDLEKIQQAQGSFTFDEVIRHLKWAVTTWPAKSVTQIIELIEINK